MKSSAQAVDSTVDIKKAATILAVMDRDKVRIPDSEPVIFVQTLSMIMPENTNDCQVAFVYFLGRDRLPA